MECGGELVFSGMAKKAAAKKTGANVTRAKQKTSADTARSGPSASVDDVLAELRAMGSADHRDGMARFGIEGDTASRAFGVRTGDVRALAKRLGRTHELSQRLFKTGYYEARLLAAFVGEPAKLTPAMMTAWAEEFDNWATCDTACFDLFDKVEPSLAFDMVRAWSKREEEFVKRAAFALLAGVAQHNKKLPDKVLECAFPIIEQAATDPRNFVKKGVSWALRGIGQRSPSLLARAKKTAERLAKSEHAAARWVGKDALREFEKRDRR